MKSLNARHSSAVSHLFDRRGSRCVAVLVSFASAAILFSSSANGQASGLNVASNLTFGSSQNTLIDLGGTSPAPLGQTVGVGYYDWIKVGNNWTWSGSPRFTVSTFGGFEPKLGDQFDIVTWGGSRSATTSSVIFDVPQLTTTKWSWNVDFGTVTNSRLRLTVVPEPAGLSLAGAATSLVLTRRRRARVAPPQC